MTSNSLLVIWLFFLFCFIEANPMDSYQKPSSDTCTYTFTVPRSAAVQCGQDDDLSNASNAIDELRQLVTNQHASIEERINELRLELNLIKPTELPTQSNSGSGTVYNIWGRTECPGDASLIYGGQMGKSHYTHGGGVNYMCMPSEPEFPEGAMEGHQSQSYVYGVEYEKQSSPLIDARLHDQDAPCAVCEVRGRSIKLMIPAKLSCPAGWTMEYKGLLMAQHHTQHASDFICVANGMETLDGGNTNENGGLLYVVEGVCGSLKCPPYIQGYEFGCVVCTK